MSDSLVTMVDTIHASVGLDLAGFPYVAGYVSGTPGIKWTPGDWGLFGHSKKVRIWQGYAGTPVDFRAWDVIDVEKGAVTVAQAAAAVNARVTNGIQWTTIYGSDSTLAEVAKAVQAYGGHVWVGHVNAWLADWNLSLAEASKIIGTMVHGMTCIAVQWASPSSNPGTILPGTGKTLKQANVDLSVVDGTWVPSGGWGAPVPPIKPPVPPVPPTPAKRAVKLVVDYSDGTTFTLAL
jgi:hypothetical protein